MLNFPMHCGFQSNLKKVFDECTQYFISFDNFHIFKAGGYNMIKWQKIFVECKTHNKCYVIHANKRETFEVLFKRYIKKYIFVQQQQQKKC